MYQKINSWLVTTLILTLGYGQLFRFSLFSLPLYLHDVLVLLLLLLSLPLLPKVALRSLRSHRLFFGGVALGWVYALVLYKVVVLLVPFLYTLRLIVYLLLYGVIKERHITLPPKIFLLSGFISLVIGVTQYLFLPDMRLFQALGWDDHLNRLTLPHFDPTFSGHFLVLTGLLAWQTRVFWLSILCLPAILLTYARSVWLSLLLTLATGLRLSQFLRFLAATLIFIIGLGYFGSRMAGEGTNLLRSYSLVSRLESDWVYLRQVGWGSIVGRGLNTLPLLGKAADMRLSDHSTGPNNSYLYLLLTCGLLGLAGGLRMLYRLHRATPYPLLLRYLAVASLFNNVLFYPFIMLWFLLLTATAPSAKSNPGSSHFLLRQSPLP